MHVTEQEAAAMYARACRSWYGIKANSVLNSQIKRLMAKADARGVKAWQQVAQALENLEDERSTGRTAGKLRAEPRAWRGGHGSMSRPVGGRGRDCASASAVHSCWPGV